MKYLTYVLLNLFFLSCIYSSYLVEIGEVELSSFEWLVNLIYNVESGELNSFFSLVYDPETGVGYVFIAFVIVFDIK